MRLLILLILAHLVFISCEIDNDEDVHLEFEDLKSTWIFYEFIDISTQNSSCLPDELHSECTFHGDDCIMVIGPCNSGPGKYEVNHNHITITALALTEKACNLTIMGYEQKFVENLSGTYQIKGDTLSIFSDEDTNLRFVRSDSTKVYDCFDF